MSTKFFLVDGFAVICDVLSEAVVVTYEQPQIEISMPKFIPNSPELSNLISDLVEMKTGKR